MQEEGEIINTVRENNVKENELEMLMDRTPEWAIYETHRDANKKQIGEEGYDPTTLHIPKLEYQRLTNVRK